MYIPSNVGAWMLAAYMHALRVRYAFAVVFRVCQRVVCLLRIRRFAHAGIYMCVHVGLS